MKTIGIVCEGPTDYLLLKHVIDKITGEDNYYLSLQPDDDLTGEYGNGWKGVWKWCMDHGETLESYMKEIVPQVDILVVQMDGDVSRKEKEVHCLCSSTKCELKEKVHPLACAKIKENACPVELPCEAHDASVQSYMEHLTGLILGWIRQEKNACIVIPCDSTDAWVVAAYDKLADIETLEDPWKNIISKKKTYHGVRIHGHQKNLVAYRSFLDTVCDNWDEIKKLCVSAERFESSIREHYERLQ